MGGLIGRLFQEFAITSGGDSGIGCGLPHTHPHALQPVVEAAPGERAARRLYRTIEGVWEKSLGGYQRSLAWVMDRRPLAMVFMALILIGTVLMGRLVPKGFFPVRTRASSRARPKSWREAATMRWSCPRAGPGPHWE